MRELIRPGNWSADSVKLFSAVVERGKSKVERVRSEYYKNMGLFVAEYNTYNAGRFKRTLCIVGTSSVAADNMLINLSVAGDDEVLFRLLHHAFLIGM